ncbi:MAG TPA: hypothetical protein VIK53_02330 [Verrucomicrobiae bacterium]
MPDISRAACEYTQPKDEFFAVFEKLLHIKQPNRRKVREKMIYFFATTLERKRLKAVGNSTELGRGAVMRIVVAVAL